MSESVEEKVTKVPQNTRLEKALLSAILYNNRHYDDVKGIISGEHFYLPVHRRLFQLIEAVIRQNRVATTETVRPYVEQEPLLKEIGGAEYFADLVATNIAPRNARQYAEQVREFAIRRTLMNIGSTLNSEAATVKATTTADRIIDDTEQVLYKLRTEGRADAGFRPFSEVQLEAVRRAKRASMLTSKIAGLSTGLRELDSKLGGLHRSDLIVIAGRPGMGKTALATNIAYNVARNYRILTAQDGTTTQLGGKVAILSMEMSSEQLVARILAESSRVPATRIRNSRINPSEFAQYAKAASQCFSLPLYIDDSPGLSIADISVRCHRLQRMIDGIDLIVVDYVQLAKASSKFQNRNYEIAEITAGLKSLAKNLDTPVIAISQLSRMTENREDQKPQLSDLRDSGSIEQDADLVLFVYRKAYYLERSKPDESEQKKLLLWQEQSREHHNMAEIIIGKNRHGPTGALKLTFNGALTKFGDYDHKAKLEQKQAEAAQEEEASAAFG